MVVSAKLEQKSAIAKQKLNAQLDRLSELFYYPKNDLKKRELIKSFLDNSNLDEKERDRVRRRFLAGKFLKQIPLKWGTNAKLKRVLYSVRSDLQPFEIAQGFFEKYYVGFGTCLFWHDLTDQLPSLYYVISPRKTPPTKTSFEIDNFGLREVFIKPVKESSNLGTYQGYKYVLLERPNYNDQGLEKRVIQTKSGDLEVVITNLERTLLDCAVYPERAGGALNVAEAFRRAAEKLNVSELGKLYNLYDLSYPHWQRISFYLEKYVSSRAAEDFMEQIGNPKAEYEFFLQHSYRPEWDFDSRYQIHFPRGLV